MTSIKFFIFQFSFFILLTQRPLFSEQSEQDKSAPTCATVLADKVNIRAGQGINFEILGQLNKEATVEVTDQEYDWYKIKLPSQTPCFVHKDYIEEGRVKANRLRVRARNRGDSNVLGILKEGEIVNVLEETGDWLKIAPPEACSGWVKKEYLTLSTAKRKTVAEDTRTSLSVEKKIKAEGLIDDLGKIVNRQGTHKLIQDKQTVYYLKSEVLDLNCYVYHKVTVEGELKEVKNSPYPVIEVEKIDVKR